MFPFFHFYIFLVIIINTSLTPSFFKTCYANPTRAVTHSVDNRVSVMRNISHTLPVGSLTPQNTANKSPNISQTVEANECPEGLSRCRAQFEKEWMIRTNSSVAPLVFPNPFVQPEQFIATARQPCRCTCQLGWSGSFCSVCRVDKYTSTTQTMQKWEDEVLGVVPLPPAKIHRPPNISIPDKVIPYHSIVRPVSITKTVPIAQVISSLGLPANIMNSGENEQEDSDVIREIKTSTIPPFKDNDTPIMRTPENKDTVSTDSNGQHCNRCRSGHYTWPWCIPVRSLQANFTFFVKNIHDLQKELPSIPFITAMGADMEFFLAGRNQPDEENSIKEALVMSATMNINRGKGDKWLNPIHRDNPYTLWKQSRVPDFVRCVNSQTMTVSVTPVYYEVIPDASVSSTSKPSSKGSTMVTFQIIVLGRGFTGRNAIGTGEFMARPGMSDIEGAHSFRYPSMGSSGMGGGDPFNLGKAIESNEIPNGNMSKIQSNDISEVVEIATAEEVAKAEKCIAELFGGTSRDSLKFITPTSDKQKIASDSVNLVNSQTFKQANKMIRALKSDGASIRVPLLSITKISSVITSSIFNFSSGINSDIKHPYVLCNSDNLAAGQMIEKGSTARLHIGNKVKQYMHTDGSVAAPLSVEFLPFSTLSMFSLLQLSTVRPIISQRINQSSIPPSVSAEDSATEEWYNTNIFSNPLLPTMQTIRGSASDSRAVPVNYPTFLITIAALMSPLGSHKLGMLKYLRDRKRDTIPLAIWQRPTPPPPMFPIISFFDPFRSPNEVIQAVNDGTFLTPRHSHDIDPISVMSSLYDGSLIDRLLPSLGSSIAREAIMGAGTDTNRLALMAIIDSGILIPAQDGSGGGLCAALPMPITHEDKPKSLNFLYWLIPLCVVVLVFISLLGYYCIFVLPYSNFVRDMTSNGYDKCIRNIEACEMGTIMKELESQIFTSDCKTDNDVSKTPKDGGVHCGQGVLETAEVGDDRSYKPPVLSRQVDSNTPYKKTMVITSNKSSETKYSVEAPLTVDIFSEEGGEMHYFQSRFVDRAKNPMEAALAKIEQIKLKRSLGNK